MLWPDATLSDDGRVSVYEGAGADGGAVLQEAVVVACDGAVADVGGGPDGGVAQIAQMVGLGALAQFGVLDLDEVADMGAAAELGPRPQPREGAEHHVIADLGALEVAEAADLDAVADADAGAEEQIGRAHV